MNFDLNSVDYILETTRSVRKRLDLTRPVDRDVVMRCIEIALQAPTGSNRQGWKWLVLSDADKKAKIGQYYKDSWYSYAGVAARSAPGEEPSAQMKRVISSARYLADHMGEVPMMIFPCVEGRAGDASERVAALLHDAAGLPVLRRARYPDIPVLAPDISPVERQRHQVRRQQDGRNYGIRPGAARGSRRRLVR